MGKTDIELFIQLFCLFAQWHSCLFLDDFLIVHGSYMAKDFALQARYQKHGFQESCYQATTSVAYKLVQHDMAKHI